MHINKKTYFNVKVRIINYDAKPMRGPELSGLPLNPLLLRINKDERPLPIDPKRFNISQVIIENVCII